MAEIELFHVHKKNKTDNKWKVNNTIKVDESFKSTMLERHNSFSDLVQVSPNELANLYEVLLQYMLAIKDVRSLRGKDLVELRSILAASYDVSYNANFFRREQGLEDCRRENYIELPSRLHSIYCCDEDGLEYWSDVISSNGVDEIEVYKTYINGKVFKTNEQLIPNEHCNYEETVRGAFKYWHPKFGNVPTYTNEYLVQGDIKVLEKVK